MTWHYSSGTLKYYPYGDWWVILYCDNGIIEYYRYYLEKRGIKLQKPKHGAHISIVRGEGEPEPEHKENWLWNDGGLVLFQYSNEVVFGETHVWLPVRSQSLDELRQYLGLAPKPQFRFHLTLGRF